MEIKKIARAMFDIWSQALQTGDKRKVAELYTKDSTFLPTLSGVFKFGMQGAEDYFKHFLEKKPIGRIEIDRVQGNKNLIIHSGLYIFEVDEQNGQGRTDVKARFTFIYQKQKNGGYKILHHHSSLKPFKL